MDPKKIIISIITSLLIGVMVSMSWQYLTLKREKDKALREAINENPFYNEFQKSGARFGLNMEFTKSASCVGASPLELKQFPLISYGPKSCDILLVGDSSMAWSLIPEVVEQMTGLKLGVFATEALTLNITVAKMIDNLASYYLKDNGLLIISFGGWTQEQNASSLVMVYPDWINKVSGMNHDEYARFMEQFKRDEIAEGAQKGISGMLTYSEYRKAYGSVKNFLTDTLHLSLLQIQLYSDYIEPVLNPKWYKQKIAMKEKIHCFLRWNNRSITMYTSNAIKRSHHSDSQPDATYTNKDIAVVSAILKKINCRKAYQISINYDDSKYSKLRSIYEVYYRDSFSLIDLGKEHPVDASYDLDSMEHTINSGGFYQSILIGSYLKKNFGSLGKK